MTTWTRRSWCWQCGCVVLGVSMLDGCTATPRAARMPPREAAGRILVEANWGVCEPGDWKVAVGDWGVCEWRIEGEPNTPPRTGHRMLTAAERARLRELIDAVTPLDGMCGCAVYCGSDDFRLTMQRGPHEVFYGFGPGFNQAPPACLDQLPALRLLTYVAQLSGLGEKTSSITFLAEAEAAWTAAVEAQP